MKRQNIISVILVCFGVSAVHAELASSSAHTVENTSVTEVGGHGVSQPVAPLDESPAAAEEEGKSTIDTIGHDDIQDHFLQIGHGILVETVTEEEEAGVTEVIEPVSDEEFEITVTSDSMVKEMKKHMKPQEQIPTRTKGFATPEGILQKQGVVSPRNRGKHYQFFSAQSSALMPYLDGLYHIGNTCIQADPLFDMPIISSFAQSVKAKMGRAGIYYSLNYGINYSGVTGPLQDASRRNFVSQNGALMFNANIFRDSETSEGLFLSSKLIFGDGFGFNEDQSNPQRSIGSLVQPAGAMNGQTCNLTQVALGYVSMRGKLVVMAGQIDFGNYMDTNAYSNYQSNNLTHGGYDRNSCLSLTSGSLGFHIAYQPSKKFYVLFASSSNNTPRNHNPFETIDSGSWSNVAELGYINPNVAGLGQGTYRLLPFMLTNKDKFGGGIACNIQQQLGKNSHLGYFFRGGWASEQAASLTGVRANISTGFALLSPIHGSGAANANYLGLGFIWLQGAKSGRPNNNNNEYGMELTYVQQVTPTMAIQPDIQVIKNPSYGRKGQTNVIFQIQNRWDF